MDVRTSYSKLPWVVALAAIAGLVLCISLLRFRGDDHSSARGGVLQVHCAAGIRGPVESLAQAFRERTGTRVELTYGGSGTLLAAIKAGAPGDLFIAGDVSFIDRAEAAGAVRERLDLAAMRPVIAVRSGNPHEIRALADLARPEIRVGLGNAEATAIGRLTKGALEGIGLWESTRNAVKVFKPTVNELGNDLQLGAIDATVVWDATLARYEGLEAVRVDPLEALPSYVTVGLLSRCDQPARALGFARFLASVDQGAPVFAEHGFTPGGGDPFVESPSIVLMSGAMLRPAVEETLQAFEAREGVSIERVYNGCGVLVAQMRAGRLPDAYFSCDRSFLRDVQQHFEIGFELASNPMVLLVQPGNPHRIRVLRDLLKPGLRVGLGHPKKSALGALTEKLLIREGSHASLAESGNLKVESPTGDLLVNQLRAGSLDAAIVYTSNAALAGADVESVQIESPGALAVQPFAIGHGSEHKALVTRLIGALRAAESRVRFSDLGFQWLGGSPR